MASVADNLQNVRDRIEAACALAGRAAASVTLVAVCKRVPLSQVVEAYEAGQVDLAENRIQDALPRQDDLHERLARRGYGDHPVRWHFVGSLQNNKVRKAVGSFDLLHAVDSVPLAERIGRVAAELGLRQAVLLEVNVSREPQKHGLDPADVAAAAAACAGVAGLELRGLMGMAQADAPESDLRRTFAELRRLNEAARAASGLQLPDLSMGMTDDFEHAIAEGATLVRVGTGVFGPREAP